MADFRSDENLVARWLDGPYGCGLQIGEPSIIAAVCGTTTVTQFRRWTTRSAERARRSCTISTNFDYVAFRDIGPLLTLNIGGIANCQLADRDRSRMMAFDTGPGNVMMDHVALKLLGKPYDADGETASHGNVDLAVIIKDGTIHKNTALNYGSPRPKRSTLV